MLCRICLLEVEPSKIINIFTEMRKQELISDLIMNFAYVEVFENDDLPKIICTECLKHLLEVYEFKDKILKSDKHLRNVHDVSLDSDETSRFFNDVYCAIDEPIVQINFQGTPINFPSCNEQNENTKCSKPCVENTELEPQYNKNDVKNNVKKRKMYRCNQCQSSFKSRYNLILHKTSHTGIFPHNCDICKKGFATNWAMNVHRRIHFSERPFKCEVCDKSFKSKSAQIIHKKIHLGIKHYQCKICNKQFAQMGGLKAHQYTHTTEKPLVCEFCGKHYTSKRALERHYKVHNGEPRLPCSICGKLYSGDVNLNIHMKTIHCGDRVRFPCEVCDKSFSTKSVLKVHMRIHDGVKPYSCDICGKSFRQASVATLHKRVHTGETPFPCLLCDRKFSYKHHLKKHLEREHPGKELDI